MTAHRHICPHCHGEGYVATIATSGAEIEAIAAALRESCRALGVAISGDDRVDEATAAVLLGRKKKTLGNWRHTHRPIAFVERCRRISYAVPELARWMHESSRCLD